MPTTDSIRTTTPPAVTVVPAAAPAIVPVAIIGLNFGRHVVDTLMSGKHPARVAGVCDLDQAKTAAMAARHGVRAYASLDEILADPTVPAVGLFTGPAGRAALIARCIAAGKHVMTTKPFELDAAAGAAVLVEARRLGRVVHLNSPAPVAPQDLAQIAAWRAQYDLGPLVACHSEVWASYREQADGSWYDDPRRCPVAPLYRLGIYLLNDLLRLGGAVTRVHVETSRLFTGRPTPDQAQVSLRFASGAIGNVFASFCVEDGDHYRNALTLHFARGTVYRNVGAQRGTTRADLALVRGDGSGRREVATAAVEQTSGDYDWTAFAAAVAAGRPLDEEAAAVAVDGVRVMTAIAEAERTGLPAEVKSLPAEVKP